MKINQIIIFALLIIFAYSDDCESETTSTSKPGDCGDLTEEQKKQKYTKCCLVKYDDITNVGGTYSYNYNPSSPSTSVKTWVDGEPYCKAFREKTLKNLKTYIEYQEVKSGYEKMEIDCNSNYIKLSLIGLLLFFI